MPLALKTWGSFACFTRPDTKVERMSYPVITPTAAKGLIESIFWKPEIEWRILEIRVLKPIQFIRLTRRELKGKSQTKTSLDRTLRQTLALKDVAYEIIADLKRVGRGRDAPRQKYVAQFERRVRKGQCFRDPYLGLLEFPAFFCPPQGDSPISETRPIGAMPLQMNWKESWHTSDPPFPDACDPEFFDAVLEDGVLHVPSSS